MLWFTRPGVQDIFTIWLFLYWISGAGTQSAGRPAFWGRALPLASLPWLLSWVLTSASSKWSIKSLNTSLRSSRVWGLTCLTYLCLEGTLLLRIFQCPSPFCNTNRPCQDLTNSPQSGWNRLLRKLALEASEMTFKHDLWHNISNAHSVQAISDVA